MNFNQIKGCWVSINSDDKPQYNANFNMTDFSPSYENIQIEFSDKKKLVLKVFGDGKTTPKEWSFKLIDADLFLRNNEIIVEEINIPIISLERDFMTLKLFKTRIQFRNTSTTSQTPAS